MVTELTDVEKQAAYIARVGKDKRVYAIDLALDLGEFFPAPVADGVAEAIERYYWRCHETVWATED